MFKLNWNDINENWSRACYGIFEISCCPGREYKDGTRQFMIYLCVPSAASKEIITLTKVRGYIKDAKLKAEEFLELRDVE